MTKDYPAELDTASPLQSQAFDLPKEAIYQCHPDEGQDLTAQPK